MLLYLNGYGGLYGIGMRVSESVGVLFDRHWRAALSGSKRKTVFGNRMGIRKRQCYSVFPRFHVL